MNSLVDVKKIFGAVVGTARCAVRAAQSGATNVVGRMIAYIPRALRAVTPQRGVPTIDGEGASIQ